MKIILLSLIVGLLIVGYVLGKKSLLMVYSTRLDPIGLNYYGDEIGREEKLNPLIMFYGDSRALSWGRPMVEQYHVINRAIGGQTSLQIVSRFQQHVVPHRPHIVILQMCINDLKMVSLFPEQKKEIVENCKKNILEMVKEAKKIKARILLTTVFPLGDIPIVQNILGIEEQPILDAIDEVNLYIRSLENENTIIFDTYYLLKGSTRKINPQYSEDWLHLNGDGYKLLNKKLLNYL